MTSLNFEIEIQASRAKVWYALWNPNYYTLWTSAFSEGSRYEGELITGGLIRFLNQDGNGMEAKIEEALAPETMCFAPIGDVKEGKRINEDWLGYTENYYLEEKEEGSTLLKVQLDTVPDYVSYFEEVFPKALEILKKNAEEIRITVKAKVNAGIGRVWDCWTSPAHIVNWYFASEDWQAPAATNDLKVGGVFVTTMAAKDGSFSFDFAGVYTELILQSLIEYTMEDGRKCSIHFIENDGSVDIRQSFEPESQNSLELQEQGWGAILNSFKSYVDNF
jgi:uncharacterized protein YndB with AHSA1/START domain